MNLENFLKDNFYTLNALYVLGTWTAVITSLWLARTSSNPRLEISAGQKVIYTSGPGGQYAKENGFVLGVTLRNVGPSVIYINYWSFDWRLAWPCKQCCQQNPVTDFKAKPLRLEPGESTSIILCDNISELSNALDKLGYNNLKFLKRFISLHVTTSNGFQFKAKLGKSLKEAIVAG